MENDHTNRPSSRKARDVRSEPAAGSRRPEAARRHPDDPTGHNPQAPGHIRKPTKGNIPVVAAIIGAILVASLVLFLIFGNAGLRDESAPATGQTGATAPETAPAAIPETAPGAPADMTDPAPAAPPPPGD